LQTFKPNALKTAQKNEKYFFKHVSEKLYFQILGLDQQGVRFTLVYMSVVFIYTISSIAVHFWLKK